MTAGSDAPATIGVIGGSGLYSLFEDAAQSDIATPYGPTSSPITVGTLGGRRVAFLTRHGSGHTLPPHRIPYRANIWALASLGVRALVTSSAVGGLRADVAPGTFVVTDQLVDRTTGRDSTFFDEGRVEHLAAADPFDPALRALAVDALGQQAVPLFDHGTAVVIQGPRFSTRAESRWYAAMGGDTINMTLAPEVPLALELGIGTVNLSFVTDSDAAVERGHADAVSGELVLRRLADAQPVIRTAIAAVVAGVPDDFEPRTGIADDAVQQVLTRPVVP
ncbi:MTAP family purine nucleoside phosphorylase [uncultured Amnibacterium sp.]|uniref:MTAP family purine nucleoside phosphorylase n=1 Tax=uncultured Amnibacterium sp. TaxID=1631851 RepID=UPI0035CB054D